MTRKFILKLILVVFVCSCASISQSQTNKLFVYYPTWAVYTMPPRDLKFPSGIQTIYMHFSAHMATTSPYFSAVVPAASADSAALAYLQRALIDTCHRNGQKVLLSITAQDNTMGNVAANVTQRRAFVSSVCSYLKRKGYDGVDLDWETNLNAANVTALIKDFRDTLNTWTTPGILTMATITDPFIYPGVWNFYNTSTMNTYLDAYFGMNYVMNTAERSSGSLGNANSVWRCMFDSPYTQPTSAPWSTYTGGYWAADFKRNGVAKWLANGADTTKVGIGLWNGGSTMLNSNSSSVPGSPVSYGTPGYVGYASVLGVSSTYDVQADSRWGVVNGLYCSWIDSAGAYKRTKWAKDTMRTNIFMLYDAHSGFISTGQRYGRQPHFDAMVKAINAPQLPLPTGTFFVTPDTLPVGGGSVNLTWTSSGATGATINQGIGTVGLSGSTALTVGQTTTYTLTLLNGSGSRSYVARVGVALPGGQGPQDITSQGSPVALITAPTGGGNSNIEIIRDGVTPQVGGSNPLDQFDTYNGGGARVFDWIGYQFTSSRTFSSIIYQEGLDNQWGGCFVTLQVQVRNNGQWTNAQGLVSTPQYPGSNLANFETYQLSFDPTTGDGIRLAGEPTGQGHYIGVAELRVMGTGTTSSGTPPRLPKDYGLEQNYPNPFNPTTTIMYSLPEAGYVTIDVFNLLGQSVATLVNEAKAAGRHSVSFLANNLADGFYFYSIRAGSFSEMKKMILLK